jgi:hypothetical protein
VPLRNDEVRGDATAARAGVREVYDRHAVALLPARLAHVERRGAVVIELPRQLLEARAFRLAEDRQTKSRQAEKRQAAKEKWDSHESLPVRVSSRADDLAVAAPNIAATLYKPPSMRRSRHLTSTHARTASAPARRILRPAGSEKIHPRAKIFIRARPLSYPRARRFPVFLNASRPVENFAACGKLFSARAASLARPLCYPVAPYTEVRACRAPRASAPRGQLYPRRSFAHHAESQHRLRPFAPSY